MYCLDEPCSGTGIDQFHEFKYMGAAEFEFGTLNKNLKLMREHTEEMSVHAIDCTPISSDTPLFYAGRDEEVELCQSVLEAEKTGKPIRLKEALWPKYAIQGKEKRLNGWWAVHNGMMRIRADAWIPFAFFLNERHAEKWLELL